MMIFPASCHPATALLGIVQPPPSFAIVGKGGVGKTTIAAFTLRYLLENGIKPLLAVDADPSACLAAALGVEVGETIGGIREDTRSAVNKLPPGISKSEFLGLKIQEAITEANGFDFLAMGRPEGPGCYCFVNNVLRDHLDRLTQHYRATVIDCEAGLEHLSRRTTLGVNTMICVADPTIKALEALRTVLEIAAQLNAKVKRKLLIINRVPDHAQEQVRKVVEQKLDLTAFEAHGFIPEDPAIFAAELTGSNLLAMNSNTSAYQAYKCFLDSLPQALQK